MEGRDSREEIKGRKEAKAEIEGREQRKEGRGRR
jgi:hypothetical protein